MGKSDHSSGDNWPQLVRWDFEDWVCSAMAERFSTWTEPAREFISPVSRRSGGPNPTKE